MKYTYKEGIQKSKSIPWTVGSAIMAISGIYLLANVISPALPEVSKPVDAVAKQLATTPPAPHEDRLYIPKLNLNVAIVPIGDNEKAALEKGAIHRSPGSGNPESGGNFVLAAHRFNLGLTPQQTRARSPFYHIDMLNQGDTIYIDYKNSRYVYEITERKLVKPTAVEIEAPTTDNRLTLYSCELAGEKAGREVVLAKPTGKVVLTDTGQQKLQPL